MSFSDLNSEGDLLRFLSWCEPQEMSKKYRFIIGGSSFIIDLGVFLSVKILNMLR